MSMKTVFSFNRSWYFFRRSLFFNIRSILLSLMLVYVILVILFMVLSTIVYPSTLWHNPEFYFMTEDKIRFVGLFLYGIGLFVFLCISPWCFGFLPSDTIKSRLTIELMIPASPLEQYVVRWLFCIFGGSLLYHVVFVGADITRCWVLGCCIRDWKDSGCVIFGHSIPLLPNFLGSCSWAVCVISSLSISFAAAFGEGMPISKLRCFCF